MMRAGERERDREKQRKHTHTQNERIKHEIYDLLTSQILATNWNEKKQNKTGERKTEKSP